MERKILTLEEVLSLDRRPTLQDMVDLSIEDYTKYLYQKGIIPHILKEGLIDFSFNKYDGYDYCPGRDIIYNIKEWYEGEEIKIGGRYEILNESERMDEFGTKTPEKIVFYVNGEKEEYILTQYHIDFINKMWS